MNLKEKIEKDFLEAVKKREEIAISTLRLLKAAVKNEEIKEIKKLDDAGVERIIRREIKQRNDSIAEYEKGGRIDLVKKETEEMDFLKSYLPEEMPEEELRKIIAGVMEEMGEVTERDFGRVMGAAVKEVAGRADGALVGKIVKEMLAGS